MKIQLASDLHLEFLRRPWPGERLIEPVPGAEVLVLAGDIAAGALACNLFADWPVPVIYIAGNHEFFEQDMESTIDRIRQKARDSNIHFLDRDSVVIGGVRFLGATLWTDYRLWQGVLQSRLMRVCKDGLNDHRLIRTGHRTFMPEDALALHEVSREWLASQLTAPFAGKTVVATHHGPHPLSVHPRYAGDELTSGFVSDLSDVLPLADLWVHGHVHDSFNYIVEGCRVVANPAGYILNLRHCKVGEPFKFENAAFRPDLVVEV